MTTATEQAKKIISDLLLERLGHIIELDDCPDCCSKMENGGCELADEGVKTVDMLDCPQDQIFSDTFADDVLTRIEPILAMKTAKAVMDIVEKEILKEIHSQPAEEKVDEL